MKLLIQIFLFISFSKFQCNFWESGDLPGQEIKETEEIFEKKPEEKEGMNVSDVNELLEPKDTNVTLPKNRLEEIFDQYFLAELNDEKLTIIGECEKNLLDGKCYVVEPSKLSDHFNNYYFYTNSQNQVYSIMPLMIKNRGI